MKNRHSESVKPLLTTNFKKDYPSILLSPSDIGVRRNFGRPGTRMGPEAILNAFKKLQNHLTIEGINLYQVSYQQLERADFDSAQTDETKNIESYLREKTSRKLIHLGGGHDHVFPLLSALNSSSQQIIILNLDAHCDTRKDIRTHSGTPFRNFDELSPKNCHLIQIGIHDYANGKSTLENLNSLEQTLIFKDNLSEDNLFNLVIRELEQIDIGKDAIFLLSLDADGIKSSEMEAVSAPNHNGFGSSLVRKLISLLNEDYSSHQQVFGIYEYNPIYDNLSQKGSRLLAAFMFEFLKGRG